MATACLCRRRSHATPSQGHEAGSFVTSAPLRLCCFRRGRRQQTSLADLHHVTFDKNLHLDLLSQMVGFSSIIYFTTSLQSGDRRKCAWVHMPVPVSVCMCVTWEVILSIVNTHRGPFYLQYQHPIDTFKEKYIYILINYISTHKENDLNTVVPPLTADHKSKSHLPPSDGCGVIYIF